MQTLLNVIDDLDVRIMCVWDVWRAYDPRFLDITEPGILSFCVCSHRLILWFSFLGSLGQHVA
jgi:hypothetical protein